MICLKQGKKKAFDELYRRYSGKILYFFYQRLGRDNEKAEDFLQDLFLKIIEKESLFDSKMNFSAWIYAIANNMCKNEYRRIARTKLETNEFDIENLIDESTCTHPSNEIDLLLFQKILDVELGSMGEKHRLTFILRHQQCLTVNEISKIMECSEGTVKSRLHYTIKKLSRRFQNFNVQRVL